ncbi:MAG: hypothetical protein GF364_12835 [Candidatus Lokiarchaeota archaeon]|nr:hypothetical protein [Candidatus Lokiarchaeota archaeon]
MAIEIGSWIILITTGMIYLVFLFFDAFKRGESYGNLAYVMAVAPTTYLWYLITLPANLAEYKWFGVVGIWLVLVTLWFIAMIRDFILMRKDKNDKNKKDIDDVGLYLVLGIIVQLIICAVLPSDNIFPHMQEGSNLKWFFWLPDLHGFIGFTPEQLIVFQLFRIMVTVLIIAVIIPMILDLRAESINMWVLLIITLIFCLPFTLICWLWLPDWWAPLLFLVAVLFFITLLLLTKGSDKK